MPTLLTRLVATAAAACLLAAAPATPLVLAQDTYFFVGGQYVKLPKGDVMDGQMYVHALIPWKITHKYGIVFVTGRNSTGTYYEGTPDGREGWAQFFVRRGYRVYVTDQPARGRSAYHPDLDGPLSGSQSVTAQATESSKTDQQDLAPTPVTKLHTQWPGAGREGDPAFDQFYASIVESVPSSSDWTEQHMRVAAGALLDRIGPSILITHSQGGALGWVIADARPKLVKGIIAVEPALSPTVKPTSSETPYYGVTMTPISYDPPVTDPAQIVHVPQSAPDRPDVLACWLQGSPVRTLPTLKGIPILVVASQASSNSANHYCVSRYLTQAGVPNQFVSLPSIGITGNAHMMMLEKNSDTIAAFFARWLNAHVDDAVSAPVGYCGSSIDAAAVERLTVKTAGKIDRTNIMAIVVSGNYAESTVEYAGERFMFFQRGANGWRFAGDALPAAWPKPVAKKFTALQNERANGSAQCGNPHFVSRGSG